MDLKLLSRNKLFTGKVFTAEIDEVEYPSGRKTIREVVRHPGGATVLGAFPDGTILMIRQHRYPLGRFLWELPAGKLEPNEDPLVCAQREFAEETGYTAEHWTKIAAIHTSPGFCDELLHLYLATGLEPHPKGRQLEEGELTMTLHRMPMVDLAAMIDRGEITDAKTIIALTLGTKHINGPERPLS